MVNLGLNWSSLLGIILVVAGAGLYFLRSWRPKLARDHDIFFAAVGLLCGGILLFQGWRLDPILAFGQFLLAGTAVFFAVENIRLRGITTTQAKERTPIVDDERYVSDVYRVDAELDELEPIDDYMPMSRQIRGSRDTRLTRPSTYEDEMPRRRPSSRKSSSSSGERSSSSSRRPRPDSRDTYSSDWDNPVIERDERTSRSRNGRPTSSPSRPDERSEPKSRRTRPPQAARYQEELDQQTPPSSYVDYRPVDYSDSDENELDNSTNYER